MLQFRERKRIVTFLLALLVLGARVSFIGAETQIVPSYWISYESTGNPFGDKYLVKIDALGNILMPPKLVIPLAMYKSGGATCLGTDRSGNLVMWIGASSPRLSVYPGGKIFRAVFNQKDLSLLFFRQTQRQTSDATRLQATQRAKNNFLSFRKKTASGDFLTAFDISPVGFFTNQRNTSVDMSACSEFAGEWCPTGISSDGRAAGYALPGKTKGLTELWYQRLATEGSKIGKPVLIGRLRNGGPYGLGTITAVDISNVINGNKRLVAYLSAPERLHDGQIPDTLFVQPVDASSGKLIGKRYAVNRSLMIIWNQTIAIDPLGKFVVFSVSQRSYERPSGNFNVLLFKALDALGRPSGTAKVLAENVLGEIDVLEE